MKTEDLSALLVTLPSDREIVLKRSFNAPRELVFEAWTQPRHLRRWWGCDASTLTVCEVDLRVGGAYRFVLRTDDGMEYPFTGVYQEVAAPERLVHTQLSGFGTASEQTALVTVTFETSGDRTAVTEATRFDSSAARDAFLAAGAESGASQSFNSLAELLRTMQSLGVK